MIESQLLQSGIKYIAGVDEAGRGPCAGPLVVAAVILKDPLSSALKDVKDSKQLTSLQRDQLFELVKSNSLSYSIIEISAEEIDMLGLHKCNVEGMRRAINALDTCADYVLTDGYSIPGLTIPNLAIWKGDQVAISISAASILAKVYRDRIMIELDKRYPKYGLANHKGYITASHTAAIKEFGVLPIHRKSFANIAALIG
ncbi:MAG: ribonuclease HII [Actinobacteria bacterium]|nr:ribonuclease HII [Actinomycetota bacterium]NBY82250.1 ribonuclease HII [Actinomycetota bacterium]NCU96414.1 ribonuclease HII [Actinomycetota bacterium]NDD78321.1 ribonuclease HII [Actinomycetota bacterium]